MQLLTSRSCETFHCHQVATAAATAGPGSSASGESSGESSPEGSSRGLDAEIICANRLRQRLDNAV